VISHESPAGKIDLDEASTGDLIDQQLRDNVFTAIYKIERAAP